MCQEAAAVQSPVEKSSTQRSKRLELAQLIENAVLNGYLRPGTRLPELVMANELGVSQAAIREALQHLESLGLVVKHPNRGSFIINLTSDDLIQVYQVRRELEPLACALAAIHTNQQLVDSLQAALEKMNVAAEVHDYQAYSNADLGFHRTIWEFQPNRFLERSLKAVCLPLFANDLAGC